jgi:hypothetical protein
MIFIGFNKSKAIKNYSGIKDVKQSQIIHVYIRTVTTILTKLIDKITKS